jgi:tetratricopeptide (TPR) repeat protein
MSHFQAVSKLDSKAVEEYQRILAADPNSKVFAVLAEAYLELGIFEQAENILRRGINKHPDYAAGYLVLAKICIHKKDYPAALQLLEHTIELSPDNLLGYQLLGETHLLMKNPDAALKAHKMALFLSPSNPRSQQVVRSLEKLSAEEFEEDLFQMKPLSEQQLPDINAKKSSASSLSTSATLHREDLILDRGLSLVDALIVRQQENLARNRLIELQKKYPGNTEVISRLKMLEAEDEIEQAEEIHPVAFREKLVVDEKIQRLRRVLKVIESRKNVQEPSSSRF